MPVDWKSVSTKTSSTMKELETDLPYDILIIVFIYFTRLNQITSSSLTSGHVLGVRRILDLFLGS